MTNIAFLGVGAMGSRLILNLLKNGHRVTVYNRSPDKLKDLKAAGARTASTPKMAAESADIVISMVRDNEASRAVWLGESGAAESLSAKAIAIESSTLTPEWIRELSGEIAKTGATLLEAPVLGTRPQAEAAQLICLVGGDLEILEKVRSVLEAMSARIHHIGKLGQATAMKLAVNTQYGVQVAVWAETLAFLERQGISKSKAVEILNTLPTTAPALQIAGILMAEKKFMPMFPIELVEKDFRYAVDVAKSIDLDAQTLRSVHDTYSKAIDRGYSKDNIVGVVQIYE